MVIEPESGRSMPRIVLIITDLPVPDPPITTIDWPFGTERLMPFRTFFGPKALWTPLRTIWPASSIVSLREQKRGEDEIGGEDEDRRAHHRIGGGAADALRPALRVEAVIAAHERDDEAEHGGLDEARAYVAELQEVDGVLDIGIGVEAERARADDVASPDADRVGDVVGDGQG